MPIYRYRCKKCGRVFDYLKSGASDTPKCECGNQKLEKQMTTFSVRCQDSASTRSGCSTGTCSCSRN